MKERIRKKGWDRSTWVSLSPNGLGFTKPNHYWDMLRVLWENRDNLPYAWRILTRGVCDGCALGVSGLKDWTMEGPHLCSVRLNLLRLNTMPALDHRILSDVNRLKQFSSKDLRDLGRLPYPMLRRAGDPGFHRITWDEALTLAAEKIRCWVLGVGRLDPNTQHPTPNTALAFYLTSRGLTNETYYVAQKVARFLGTNNIDQSARICHAPSTIALKQLVGAAASTCSYKDWIGTDLLVLIGSDVP